MLDDVVAALRKDRRFSAWQVTELRGRSTPRYQVVKDVEARRVVESRQCEVRVHVEHPATTPDGGAALGESSFIVVDTAAAVLTRELDNAYARARLVRNRPWTFPRPGDDGVGAAAVR